jgi:hypothetical protein
MGLGRVRKVGRRVSSLIEGPSIALALALDERRNVSTRSSPADELHSRAWVPEFESRRTYILTA